MPDVWAARGEAAYALDKHAAAVYAFTIALCATDDGVLYRARAAALWRGRADGRKEDEGEPPRAFPLVLGLLAARDTRSTARVAAARRWRATRGRRILGFARRAQVPDMLGVVEQGGSATRPKRNPRQFNVVTQYYKSTASFPRLDTRDTAWDLSKRDRRFCCDNKFRPSLSVPVQDT